MTTVLEHRADLWREAVLASGGPKGLLRFLDRISWHAKEPGMLIGSAATMAGWASTPKHQVPPRQVERYLAQAIKMFWLVPVRRAPGRGGPMVYALEIGSSFRAEPPSFLAPVLPLRRFDVPAEPPSLTSVFAVAEPPSQPPSQPPSFAPESGLGLSKSPQSRPTPQQGGGHLVGVKSEAPAHEAWVGRAASTWGLTEEQVVSAAKMYAFAQHPEDYPGT
jgi:hypothetical protein